MEFGKKGDAKKAMKMMWREGITLKQAWKKVKGGKSPRRSRSPKRSRRRASPRRSMSPSKRKAVANAKKAMRMHHREGITLKQAWRRVNSFGATVCPKGYAPNPGWALTAPLGSQCRKECAPDQYRHPVTHRCRKYAPVKAPCPPGKIMGPKGRCRKTRDENAVVPPGYEPNPNYTIGSNRQPFIKICPRGMERTGANKCKKVDSDNRRVPPGYEPNPNYTIGSNRQPFIKACPYGTIRTAAGGRCMKVIDDNAVVPPGYEPNPNYTIGSGRQPFVKACPYGTIRTAAGKCKSIVPRLPAGYEINPESGRRRKKCKSNEYRDPFTRGCKIVKMRQLMYPEGDKYSGPKLKTEFGLEEMLAFGKDLGSDSRDIMRPTTNFGGRRRCSFGTCTACRGGK